MNHWIGYRFGLRQESDFQSSFSYAKTTCVIASLNFIADKDPIFDTFYCKLYTQLPLIRKMEQGHNTIPNTF